jgi:hypothetical protein
MLGAFFVIFMFLAINTSWADDPIPRSRTSTSYKYDRGKSGRAPTQRGAIHIHKAQLRYEKARRLAWADGKLTYRERRRLHAIRTLPEKGINRHKGNHLHYTRGPINKKHKQYFIPRFSIGFSFSKPWIH